MRKLLSSILFALGFCASTLVADTLVFNSSTVVSKVKIISINFKDGFLIFERDGRKKLIKLDKLREFFRGDINVFPGSSEVDDTASYSVSSRVEMPEYGCNIEKITKKLSLKNKRTTVKKPAPKKIEVNDCVLQWRISLKNPTGTTTIVKAPLFYLFILATSNDTPSGYKMYRFSYPDFAKLKSKSYDKSEIYAKLNSFNRPIINYRPWGGGLGRKRRFHQRSNFGEHRWVIPLKVIGAERILAWHLEIWGEGEMVEEKGNAKMDLNLEPLWWQYF